MKIYTLGLAALPLLLMATSCNKEVVESSNDGANTLTFQSALGKATRVQEFSYWANGTTDLPVKGYETGNAATPIIFDQDLTYSGGAWSYASPVNQPGFAITYYSWYPKAAATPTLSGTAGSFVYTVKETTTPQEDLVAACTSTVSPEVTLNFKHLLSQVNFAVQGISNVKVRISGISVNDVKNTSTFTFNTASTGSWATPTAVTATYNNDYAYTPVSGTNITPGTNSNVQYMGNGNSVYTNDNALMLMPQTFSAPADGTFTFTFDLYTMAQTVTDVSGNGDLAHGTATVNLSDFTTTQWVMGKRYVYLIDMSYYLVSGKINFIVQITDWVDADAPANLAQTIQVANANQASIENAIASHNTLKGGNSGLTVFPIALPDGMTLGSDVTLSDLVFSNFASTDQIRIECANATTAGHIKVSALMANFWSVAVSGNNAILTRNATAFASVTSAPAVAAAAATQVAIENAIDAQNAQGGILTTLTNFPITIPGTLSADVELEDFLSNNFQSGDVITFTVATAAESAFLKLSGNVSGWAIAGNNGSSTTVTLTKQPL